MISVVCCIVDFVRLWYIVVKVQAIHAGGPGSIPGAGTEMVLILLYIQGRTFIRNADQRSNVWTFGVYLSCMHARPNYNLNGCVY
jgi:hypothetical protein